MAKQKYKPSDSKSIKLFFREFLTVTQDMTDEEVGQLIRNLCVHATILTRDDKAGLFAWGEEPDPRSMTPEVKAIYRMLSQQIDRNFDSYHETCTRNRRAALINIAKQKGVPVEELYPDEDWDWSIRESIAACASGRSQYEYQYQEEYEYQKENQSRTLNEDACIDWHRPIPTEDEVEEYVLSHNLEHTDPGYFFDFYESIGWHVRDDGTRPDWHMLIHAWEKKQTDYKKHVDAGDNKERYPFYNDTSW